MVRSRLGIKNHDYVRLYENLPEIKNWNSMNSDPDVDTQLYWYELF